jgi:hypothetical protein
VASGFKVREIGLSTIGKDNARIPAYVILMRGADRVILSAGQPPEVDIKKPQ